MGLLSTLGNTLKQVITFDISEFTKDPVQRGTLPFGTAAVGVGKGIIGLGKFLPSLGKAVTGVVIATGLTGLIAGGGLALIPKIFKTTKKATEVILGEPITFTPIPEEPEFTREKLLALLKVGGLAGLTGAALAAATIIIPDILKTLREKEAIPDVSIPTIPDAMEELPLEKPEVAAAPIPVTPETVVVEAGPKKKPSKRRPKARQPSIRQIVKVNVMQRQSGHKFIKNTVFN